MQGSRSAQLDCVRALALRSHLKLAYDSPKQLSTYDIAVEGHIAHLDGVGALGSLPLAAVRGVARLIEGVLANVDAFVRVHFHF